MKLLRTVSCSLVLLGSAAVTGCGADESTKSLVSPSAPENAIGTDLRQEGPQRPFRPVEADSSATADHSPPLRTGTQAIDPASTSISRTAPIPASSHSPTPAATLSATVSIPSGQKSRLPTQESTPPPSGESLISGSFSPSDLESAIRPSDAPALPRAIPVDEGNAHAAETNLKPPAVEAKAEPTEGLPKATFESLNSLVLKIIKTMPHGGGYSVSSRAVEQLTSAARVSEEPGHLQVEVASAMPSFCSGATYLVFLKLIAELQEKHRLPVSKEVAESLLVKRQPDGVGVWGRWNANGPGTAKLFHDLGIGINFCEMNEAKPGDFMKIWWNDGIGSTERGHSVIYLDSGRDPDGTKWIKFWSSNQDEGYSEKKIPETKVVRVLFSRLEDPSRISEVSHLPGKDPYLSTLLDRPSSEEEMFRLCGVKAPVGSSLLAGPNRSGVDSASKTSKPSGVSVQPGPDLAAIFEPGSYREFSVSNQGKILLRAQEALVISGDYRGMPDGVPGPMTDAAIKSWQTAKGLPATGQLDDKTLRGMNLNGLTDSDLEDNVREVKANPKKENPVSTPKPGRP